MPTLVGARRRGFTPEGFRLFAERIGVSKSDSWIDMSVLEDCMRDDLNARAQRRIAVLDPVKLVIDNYPARRERGVPRAQPSAEARARTSARCRSRASCGSSATTSPRHPPKGYFRLSPGAEVRLRYAYIVRCTGFEKDADGNVTVVHCTYDPATRSGTPGADARKVKGNIHWLSAAHAVPAEVRLYDRLFAVPFPGRAQSRRAIARRRATRALPAHAHGGRRRRRRRVRRIAERNFLDDLNPDSKRIITAYVEPALVAAAPEERFQFERHGYFVADLVDHSAAQPGVQPRGDAQGFLVEVRRLTEPAFAHDAQLRAGLRAEPSA